MSQDKYITLCTPVTDPELGGGGWAKGEFSQVLYSPPPPPPKIKSWIRH